MNAPATIRRDDPMGDTAERDPCWIIYYVNGALITSNRCSSVYQAKNIANECQWFPIDYGWRSADGRTLILRDAAMGQTTLAEIEAEWKARAA